MNIYPKAKVIKEKFIFLESFGFIIIELRDENYGSYILYKGNGIKIKLGFEYKGYFFICRIYKNENTEYSDDGVGTEIFTLCMLIKKYENITDCRFLQPNKLLGYESCIDINSIMLTKYLPKILDGDFFKD